MSTPMLTLLRVINVTLIFLFVVAVLATMAGGIVFVPFIAGAWILNAFALVGYEEHARPDWAAQLRPSVEHPSPGVDVVRNRSDRGAGPAFRPGFRSPAARQNGGS